LVIALEEIMAMVIEELPLMELVIMSTNWHGCMFMGYGQFMKLITETVMDLTIKF